MLKFIRSFQTGPDRRRSLWEMVYSIFDSKREGRARDKITLVNMLNVIVVVVILLLFLCVEQLGWLHYTAAQPILCEYYPVGLLISVSCMFLLLSHLQKS